jgi:AAHS family 4-hydroxybenzoate transporter-like MFS transporter
LSSSAEPAKVDVKAFIDERAMGGRQWLLLALCFAIVALDGMDVAIWLRFSA